MRTEVGMVTLLSEDSALPSDPIRHVKEIIDLCVDVTVRRVGTLTEHFKQQSSAEGRRTQVRIRAYYMQFGGLALRYTSLTVFVSGKSCLQRSMK